MFLRDVPTKIARLWVREDLTPELRRDLVTAVYDNLFPIAVMAAIVVGLGVVILIGTPDLPLGILFGLCVSAALARIGIVLRWRPARGAIIDTASILLRERIFAGSSFAFSAALGVFTARTVMVAGAHDRMLVIALVYGYTSGVVARVSPRPWISIPSIAACVVPMSAAFLVRGGVEDVTVGLVSIMFAIGGIQAIAYIHRALVGHLRSRRHLASMARHDALTGIGNRLLLDDGLRAELSRLRRSGGLAALHYLDLDGFKGVNDGLGHQMGDLLLQEVAKRLAGLLRGGDLAARIGGDEFVVLQAGCAHPDEAQLLARRLGRAIATPFSLAGREIAISTSVGVAIAPADGSTPETWLAAADAALYRAKAQGRNRFVMAADDEAALAS